MQTLKRKTPLKAKTPLRAHKKLTSRTALASKTQLKATTCLKAKQKTAKKLKEPYHSIFGDMDICVITGERGAVPHHIFNGANKALSEMYGFILPLRADWHEGTNYSIHADVKLWTKYKRKCEEYYINTLRKTKEDWIKEFGKWW